MRVAYLYLCSVVLLPGMGLGQDVHFSQFFNAPMDLNPAMTSVHRADMRLAAVYRNQWTTVPVPYTTFGVSFDMKWYPTYALKHFWGIGGKLLYDYAGDSKLEILDANLMGAYHFIPSRRNILSLGASVNVGRRAFGVESLRFPNQWDGERYNPGLDPQEPFARLDFVFVDLAGGIHYRYQHSPRTWLNIGGAYHHFLRAQQTFYSNGTDVPRFSRLNASAQLSLQLVRRLDLLASAMWQRQEVYREIVAGGLFRWYLSLVPGRELALDFGAGWRVDDAIIPQLALHYRNWYVGLSYDYNYSPFKVATTGRGGPEMHVQYYFFRPTPPTQFKSCPVY